jgi:hypothetical protein
MKLLFLTFLIFFFFTSHSGFSQEETRSGLMMYHVFNGNIRFIPALRRVTVVDKNGVRAKGELRVFSTKEVFVNGKTFKIEEIAKIKRNPMGTKITGAGLIGLGLTVIQLELIFGAVAASIPIPPSDEQATVSISPTGLILIGSSIPFFLYSPTFKKEKWIFEAVKANTSK